MMDLASMHSATAEIAEALAEVFTPESFIIEVARTGFSVRVSGKNNETNIWIRIGVNQFGIMVDFNNIFIDEKMQRHGLLEKAMKKVYSLSTVRSLVVSSVITDKMHQFCQKNGFLPCESCMGYIMVK